MLPDLANVPHHHAMQEIVDILCTKTTNKDRSFFQAEVAYYFGKMASSMRASILTPHAGEIPVNVYSLALAPSGYGKGHSIEIMEQQFLKSFERRLLEDTFPMLTEQNLWIIANQRAARKGTDQNEEYEKAQKECMDKGTYAFTFSEASTPAVKQLRDKLILADVGSINLQIDEIGLNLIGSTDVLTLFLELYDQGRVKLKLTKNTNDNKRSEDLQGKTPANMLLFGTPAKLLDSGATEDQFYSFLDTGYARRCIFGHGHKADATGNLSAEDIFNLLTNSHNDATVHKWADHFYKLADATRHNWKMDLPKDVTVALLSYKKHCESLAANMGEHEEIQKAEISHRHSKALKLAGAYAFIDESTEVEMSHLQSAIKLIEESGEAFQEILNREKSYVRLAKYIAQVGHEVTHADIVEKLPFYPKSAGPRNDMIMLATSWGYKQHIVIKKSFVDGIEFFKGETLQKTDLNKIVVSYSNHWAYNYLEERVPFDKLHVLTQAPGMHWANHHFKDGHRLEENALPGFNTIVIDVDGRVSLQTAHELLKGYIFMAYTTKRHTEEENRFRLIFPTNYHLELDQTEYKEFMNCFMAWLPFETDDSANQRSKKWESYDGGNFFYNMEGESVDVLPFIPKTSRNEQFKQQSQQLGSLDNLERWFAGRIAAGNRNNQMIKYALCLVDAGWDLVNVRRQVLAFNGKLQEPMSENEIDSTIMVTVAKRYQRSA